MSWILLGLGLVCVIEGLVFALAPSRLDDLLEAMRNVTVDQRRLIGLAALALGVLFIFIAKSLGI